MEPPCFFLSRCPDCAGDLAMAFTTAAKRDRWRDDHERRTGHVAVELDQRPRAV